MPIKKYDIFIKKLERNVLQIHNLTALLNLRRHAAALRSTERPSRLILEWAMRASSVERSEYCINTIYYCNKKGTHCCAPFCLFLLGRICSDFFEANEVGIQSSKLTRLKHSHEACLSRFIFSNGFIFSIFKNNFWHTGK